MATYLGNGVYSVGKLERIWNVRKKVLSDAVQFADPSQSSRRFGWWKGSIPMPQTGGFYVVEFLSDEQVKVLAYIDKFGRAFSTEEGFTFPPAKEEDLFIALDDTGADNGYILVRDGGEPERVSRFVVNRMGQNSKYTFVDSWYDFGMNASKLDYFDFMTRAYLAFVYGTREAGIPKPFDEKDVFVTLASKPPAEAFASIVDNVKKSSGTPNTTISPLVERLAAELEAAGALRIGETPEITYRLVRTSSYANTFYIGVDTGVENADPVLLWGLEGALNRFLLAFNALDDNALVSESTLGGLQNTIMSFGGTQEPKFGIKNIDFGSKPGGMWEVLCSISSAIENARLPYRIVARVAIDEAAKLAAMDVLVPTGDMMPKTKYVEDASGAYPNQGRWVPLTKAECGDMAMRYALSIGLFIASVVFESARSVDAVDLTLRPAAGENGASEALEQKSPIDKLAWCKVRFTRDEYDASNGFQQAKTTDPYQAYYQAHAQFAATGVDPFESIKQQDTHVFQNGLMSKYEIPLSIETHEVFGGVKRGDLAIYFDVSMRTKAELIADAIVNSTSTSEAVKEVLRLQEENGTSDIREEMAYKRLLESLAEGQVDTHDQNDVVNVFLGDDECHAAFKKSQALEEEERPEEAVQVLSDAISDTTLTGGFIDTSEVVYRYFDSYASRIIYNLIRSGSLDGPAAIMQDKGKTVDLVPDSLYMCMLRAADILEGSFERTDEAIRFCERAITIGPTAGVAYRQLGRIHMLIGDMESSKNVLTDGLRVMIQPNDIAGAYYQLAYVLWKSGNPKAGALCYLKSIATSRIVANAAASELHELMEENSIASDDLPLKEELDGELTAQGVIVAPAPQMIDKLMQAAAAAVDEGLYPVARNLLALTLSYRNDDALVSVVSYIEEV